MFSQNGCLLMPTTKNTTQKTKVELLERQKRGKVNIMSIKAVIFDFDGTIADIPMYGKKSMRIFLNQEV